MADATTKPADGRSQRRTLVGVVTRDKMAKTRRVEVQRLVGVLLAHDEAVDSHDRSFTGVNLASNCISRALDLAFLESLFDGGYCSPALLDGIDQRPGGLLDVVGQRFNGVRTRKRVYRPGHVGLVGENLLAP